LSRRGPSPDGDGSPPGTTSGAHRFVGIGFTDTVGLTGMGYLASAGPVNIVTADRVIAVQMATAAETRRVRK
jgi:hypothetical protein